MKTITRILHNVVINTKTEELFVALRRKINVVRRFIPVSIRHKFPSIGRAIPDAADYPVNDSYSLQRDLTNFRINRSDYVQWRLFYGVRDNALKKAKACLKDNSVILDIGANFGAFSLKLASYAVSQNLLQTQIHAFEPNPVAFKNLELNLTLNPQLMTIVRPYATALGRENQLSSFSYSETNTGAGRIIKSPGRIQVPVKKLDDFVEEAGIGKISFIKLIVEGFEPAVLEGGWQTIQKHKPPLFFEVTEKWWKENNVSIDDVLGKLGELGYRFTIEHYNEMIRYQPEKFTSRTQFNLFATI